jgi:hypothetical protein
VTEIAALDPGVRPDEIGTPWPIQSPGFFSDAGSQGCLHLAFEMPGTGSGSGSAGLVAGGAGYPQTAGAAAPAAGLSSVAGTPTGGVVNQLADSGAPLPLDDSLPAADAAKVQAMMRFADSVLGKPYIYGGGHGGWGPQPGYDCSGFVSAVLHAGGYLNAPVDTTALPDQAGIVSGPGKVVTIFDRALPGQNGHVIIRINGQFYESGGRKGPWGGGLGVEKIGKPSDAYLADFPNVLHPEGL